MGFLNIKRSISIQHDVAASRRLQPEGLSEKALSTDW
jgi:hypothetical protein